MKIRVVFLMNSLGVGGAERLFVDQARFFNREKFELILVTLFQFPDEPDLYRELPADVTVHKLHFNGFRDGAAWRTLYHLLRNIRPDAVVSGLFFANTVARVLQPVGGYLSIACEHNTYTQKTILQRVVDHILAWRSYRLVAVSETVAAFTARQEKIPRRKFVVIPNGIDAHLLQQKYADAPSRQVLRTELGYADSDFVVLSIARLVPQKNQSLLLHGFAEFHARHSQARLILVGDGPLRESLEKEARLLNIADVVRFAGYRADVERLYKSADVFALTSAVEGFALVCIEAMACGVPVVSTRTAGPDTYVRDGVNGFLIPEPSARSVAATLEKVLGAPDFSQGARTTAQQFDITRSVQLYEKLIADALDEKYSARNQAHS